MPSTQQHDFGANQYGRVRVTDRKVDGNGPGDFKGVAANYTAANTRAAIETRALAVIPGATATRLASCNTNDLLYGIRIATDAANVY